ncbi:MAG: decaprenyl-phosphate phosphoribosyltransferase [Candidatus Omnitrophica bacterium]|nr:decaprenyl-phosphate phosphoribosyltransferase [Candidatus Omnitrophota bacterium]
MKILLTVLEGIRPKQWLKNLFIFMPLLFGSLLFNVEKLLDSILAFVIFCLISGGVYLMNDIRDRQKDKVHPKKRKRPVASGRLSVKLASLISIILIVISLSWSYLTEWKLFIVVLLYVLLHIFYTFRIKHEVILDVILIAVGFELRIWGGAVMIGIEPSVWLQLCVFVLALFLGFIKRRQEKSLLYGKAEDHREVLRYYRPYFLDQMILISATLCVVFYGLYSVTSDVVARIGGNQMAYTIPFVVYGIFRYLYLVHVKRLGGDPGEVLISDIPFVINMIMWLLVSAFIIYNPLRMA